MTRSITLPTDVFLTHVFLIRFTSRFHSCRISGNLRFGICKFESSRVGAKSFYKVYEEVWLHMIELMKYLNWDVLDSHEDMLAVIRGEKEDSGSLNREKLFVRSLERLNWYTVIDLWGIPAMLELYTPELAGRIYPKNRREVFDDAFAILLGEAIPAARWNIRYFGAKRHRLFSDRRNRIESVLL